MECVGSNLTKFFLESGTVLTCNGRKEVTWEWKSANNLESQFVFDEPSNVDRLELTGNDHI